MSISWGQGFSNTCLFIDQDVICTKFGNLVKFVNMTTKESKFLRVDSKAAEHLAVHPCHKVLAIAESNTVNPQVLIYDYPECTNVATIDGAGSLEICLLSFSQSSYLATISGVPDFQLIIWNYCTAAMVCKTQLDYWVPTTMSFSPLDWRNLILVAESHLFLWTIETCDSIVTMRSKKIWLPAGDSPAGYQQSAVLEDARTVVATDGGRNSRYTSRPSSKSAIAGVPSRYVEEFEEAQDRVVRAVCSSHIWTAVGDLYIGCEDGQLIYINVDKMMMKIVVNPCDDDPYVTTPIAGRERDFRMNLSDMTCSQTGLYVAGLDGVVRLLSLKHTDATIESLTELHRLEGSVSKLALNYPHTRLAAVCCDGSVEVFKLSVAPVEFFTAIDCRMGRFVGVDILAPGTEYCVTIRDTNLFQIWSALNGQLTATLSLPGQCCGLASSPLAQLTVVGGENGFVYFVDCTNVHQPRVVHATRLHTTAVRFLGFDPCGQVLVTASDDGNTVVLSGQPGNQFAVLGYTAISGTIVDLAVATDQVNLLSQVAIASRTPDSKAPNKLFYFELPHETFNSSTSIPRSVKGELRDETIRKMNLNFQSPSFGCCLLPPKNGRSPSVFTVDAKYRILQEVVLPEEPPKKVGSRASFLSPSETFDSVVYDDPQVRTVASPDYQWVASYGTDGVVRLVNRLSPNESVNIRAHSFVKGGIAQAVFSADNRHLFTCGLDGCLTAIDLEITLSQLLPSSDSPMLGETISIPHNDRRLAIEALKRLPNWQAPSTEQASRLDLLSRPATSSTGSEDLIASTPTPMLGPEITWVQRMDIDSQQEEDKEYAETKMQMRTKLKTIRKAIREMADMNENLPDLEKVERQEFELDVEEQSAILQETEADIQKVREDIDLNNLSKQFIHDIIKKESYDDMKVKGRSLKAFNSVLEVSNFPLRQRSREELDKLEVIKLRRRIEMADLRDRRALTEYIMRGVSNNADEMDEVEDEEMREQYMLDGGTELPVKDGTGDLYGGKSEFLFTQTELYTREQKMYQIILINDCIYRIKETFNKDFDDVFTKKEQEINRIKEKNARIRKILIDLNQPEVEVVDPEFTTSERPERLLVVEDSEVTVERYLSPEQQKRLEDERAAEEERRRRERIDNWRERGLDDMMGGVLEVKKEDELKKDIPKPAFVLQGKPEEEWSEDERRIYAEYERKVKEHNEEREKFKKYMDSELKKLSGLIEEAKTTFDDQLATLFNKWIQVQIAVYQEELKIWRLKWSLIAEEELNFRECEISEMIQEKQQNKKTASEAVVASRRIVDLGQEEYDLMCAEDKLLEKNFRKEFSDIHGTVFDAISKAFRRRPKRHLIGGTPASAGVPMDMGSSHNLFPDRSAADYRSTNHATALEANLKELDNDSHKNDFDPQIWDRLCKYRRRKIHSEFDIKLKALELADMDHYLQRRQEEERHMQQEMGNLQHLMELLHIERRNFYGNLEVQLLMKQGQVEVEPRDKFIHDFTESMLLHRSVVETLNEHILSLGGIKVNHMIKGKEFKKRFIHLEWELRKMLMQYEDLEIRMREIEFFKITKEVQRYLSVKDYEGLVNSEIQKMEQTIATLKQHHEQNMETKKSRYRQIGEHRLQKISDKNQAISRDLAEMSVTVSERRYIKSGSDQAKMSSAQELRYQQILQRQKLVDLAKAQAREVAVLRAEVERLRMRTFPALLQHK